MGPGGPSETVKIHGAGQWPNPGRSRTEVVTWLERDDLDSSSESRRLCQELDVRRPPVCLEEAAVAGLLEQITDHRDAHQSVRAERIVHPRNTNEGAKQPSSEATEPPDRDRSNGWCTSLLGHNDVRTAFMPPDEFRKVLGLVREISLHENGCVAPRIARTLRDRAQQRFDRCRITTALTVSKHGEREHLTIRRKRRGRVVSAPVIEDEDLVLARITLEDLPNAPEQQPNRWRFVVGRNADVEHV